MFEKLAELLSFTDPVGYFESISYIGVFFAVALSGHIVPLPEDAIMLLTGYIAALGIVKLPLVIIIAFVAILIADFVMYRLSFVGAGIAVYIEKKIKTNMFSWYAERMRRHSFKMVFISRFVPGLRIIGPLAAGFIKIPPLKFFLYSICSAVIYVPGMIILGFLFHKKITPLLGAVESVQHVIFIIALVVIAVVASVWGHRKFFKKKGEKTSVPGF